MLPKISRTTIAYAAGAITAFVGSIVLIGWQLDIAGLKSFLPGTVTMKPNTAALFLLSGISLIFLQRPNRFTILIVRFLSLVIMLVGILSLCQNLFGWDIGLAGILFREPSGTIGTLHPGLMAPNTALNFIVIGFAFFLITFNRFRRNFLMEFAILFPLTVGVIGLLGYLTGLEELTGPAAYTQMAANTAGTFIVLCLGILLTVLNRQHHPISMEQKLFAGLITSATVIFFISLLSISGIKILLKEAYWVEHTQQVKNQLGNILSNVLEVQSGGRGYLLTGNDKFLLPRKEAEANLPSLINNLNVLIADNTEQMQKLVVLETLVKQRLAFSDKVVSAVRLKDKSVAYLLIATEKGNDLTNNIRVLINTMISTEDRLLQSRNEAVNGQTIRTQIIIFLSFCFQALLLAFIFLFVKKDVAGRRKAEEKLSLMNEELEGRVKERTAEITKLNRVYTVLSNVNQAIVRIKDKQTLFNEACRIAVDDGKFWMAWIGMVDEQTNKIMPVASAGQAEEYIKTINIDLNDKILGDGLIGRSLKTGVHFLTNDIINDPELIPWREKVSQLGCRSAAAFPINVFGKTIGAFMLYCDEPFFFDDAEVRLLNEMAMDISFAIEVIENELKRTQNEEELRASEERYRSTLDNMMEGCQILGFDWRYLYINSTAEKHNCRPKEELLGKKYMDIWPGIGETYVYKIIKKCMEERVSEYMENEFTFPDGTKGWFDLRIEPVPEGVFILSVDITERKQAESRKRLQSEIFETIISGAPLSGILELIVKLVEEEDPTSICSILLLDEERKHLHIGAAPHLPEVYNQAINGIEIGEAIGSCGAAAFTKKRVVAEDISTHPNWIPFRELAQSANLRSCWSEPIFDAKGNVLGTFAIYHHDPQAPVEEEIKLLTSIVYLASIAITHKRAEEEIRNMNVELEQKVEKRTQELVETNLMLQKEIEEHSQAEDRIRQVYEASPYSILLVDSKGTIRLANRTTEEYFGYDSTQLIGKDIDMLVQKEKDNHHAANISVFFANPEKQKMGAGRDLFALKKDGSVFPVEISLNPIEINGEMMVLTNIIDITERKHAESIIKLAKLEAEKANLAKSEFLSRMSHELRTPMNSILGFAQLMNMGDLKPAHKKGVDHILKSGKHLLDLINEVLDLSRIEAGKLSISLEPVQLREIMLETMDIVRPLAVERNLTIQRSDSSYDYLFAEADRQGLKQVLLNLTSNAVKYNRDGGSVLVKCELLHPENKPTVRISVTDTGNGIDPERIVKLFTPFERIGADQTKTEGTGLGLTIAKKMIEAMHGTIGVESEVGKGSTFWVELPQAEGQLDRHERLSDQIILDPEKAVLSGTILYIEDNVSNIQLVEQILEAHRPGIRLITEMYGRNAVKLAADYSPDLILLDLDLPDIHGSEVLKLLQAGPKTDAISVVVISADVMAKQIEKLLKAGAKDYLTKPLDVVEFLKVVDEIISKSTK